MNQQAVVKKRVSLSVNDRGSLRIAVVADSHSAPHPLGAKHIDAQHPDAILHAGDIGNLNVLDALAKIAPIYAVRGNIDGRSPDLADEMTVDICKGDRLLVRMLMVHIGLNGPKLKADIARLAKTEKASLVVCGHSHTPFIGRNGDVTAFNPGSIGPRRFQLPIVFGIIDITPDDIKLFHINCETGSTWTPAS